MDTIKILEKLHFIFLKKVFSKTSKYLYNIFFMSLTRSRSFYSAQQFNDRNQTKYFLPHHFDSSFTTKIDASVKTDSGYLLNDILLIEILGTIGFIRRFKQISNFKFCFYC